MTGRLDLSGQVVLVTGGTRGIGRAVVEGMLEANARVAWCGPDPIECAQVQDELADRFGEQRTLGVVGDLHDPESLTAFADSTVEAWGKVDTVVCNAADFGANTPIDALDPGTFLRVLRANVVNNFVLCRRLIPQMVERRSGSIIMITSITGYTSMPGNIPYSSSKAAIASMARSLAAQYAGDGVRVNCVSPGLIKTEASRAVWADPDGANDYVSRIIPARRIGDPGDVASACVFLASDQSQYITAATIPVDGGRLGVGQIAGLAPLPEETRAEAGPQS